MGFAQSNVSETIPRAHGWRFMHRHLFGWFEIMDGWSGQHCPLLGFERRQTVATTRFLVSGTSASRLKIYFIDKFIDRVCVSDIIYRYSRWGIVLPVNGWLSAWKTPTSKFCMLWNRTNTNCTYTSLAYCPCVSPLAANGLCQRAKTICWTRGAHRTVLQYSK